MNKTAIIDLDSILFSAAWGNKIPDPDNEGEFLRDEKGRLIYQDKTEDEISTSLDLILTTILEETEATHYIAFVKGKNTAKHRYQAKSDYKANRPKESPKWWGFTKNYSIGAWKAIEVNDIEVDDAVNIARLNIPDSFIVAIDKDLLNLEGIHYNWKSKEWIDNYFEDADLYFWRDMIVGQPGDGVSGIPKKGNAFFEKDFLSRYTFPDLINGVFNEYINYYGEDKGIKEFYKNYTCLKILDKYEGFEVPELIEFKPVREKDLDEDVDTDLWLNNL